MTTFMSMAERALEDAKRVAEDQAERKGCKFCVRRDDFKPGSPEYGRLFVVPAHYLSYDALGVLVYVTAAGRLA
jgi:hypothetical protein